MSTIIASPADEPARRAAQAWWVGEHGPELVTTSAASCVISSASATAVVRAHAERLDRPPELPSAGDR